jgi:hypothetical protein
MNHYEPTIPRAACGIGAIAMTVLTFALMVGLPAANRPDAGTVYAVAAPEPAAPGARAADGFAPTAMVAACERSNSMQAREAERPARGPQS